MMRGLFSWLIPAYLTKVKETSMPIQSFALLLAAVISASGITLWAISLGGASLMALPLPALMIAGIAARVTLK